MDVNGGLYSEYFCSPFFPRNDAAASAEKNQAPKLLSIVFGTNAKNLHINMWIEQFHHAWETGMDNDVELNYHLSHCWDLNFTPSSTPLESNHPLMCVAPPRTLTSSTSSVSLQASFSTAVTALSKTASAAGSRYRAEVSPGGGRRRRGRWPGRAAPHQVAEDICLERSMLKNVPSPEIQELEIKISPWELLNDCAAYLQGGGGGWATSL